MDGVDLGFPPANADTFRTVERPVVLAGRMASPGRADEAVVSPHFLTAHHQHVGDILTLRLSTPAQAAAGIDASQTPPAGPRVMVRIVGVIKTPFGLDSPGDSGGVIPTYALLTRYRADIMGTNTSNSPTYINGLIRLAGGEAAIPAFRADLARVTGRSDIDVLDENIWIGDPARKVTGYEAACLLAFGLAALLAALVLVGQSVARYASAAVAELLVLRAVGLTRRQAASSAAARPRAGRGRRRHARRGRRDHRLQLDADRRRLPRGTEPGDQRRLAGARHRLGRVRAARSCRDGGHRVDRLAGRAGCPRPQVPGGRGRGPGGSAGACHRRRALRARAGARPRGGPGPPGDRGGGRRRARRAGGADVLRGHLRRGPATRRGSARRGSSPPSTARTARTSPRRAIVGAVAGVLGVLAALTFSAGISDAVANPARFGQTWQLVALYGQDGQSLAPASVVSRAAAADPDVTGYLDVRIGGAQSGPVSIESFTYTPVDGKQVPVVLTEGRMPASPAEIALAPTTARDLHAGVGSVVRLAGGAAARPMTVSGIAFVPSGPHNNYDQGAWLTPGGYDRLFAGAHYAYKFLAAVISLRPGANAAAVASRLDASVAKATHVQGVTFMPPSPLPTAELEDVSVLPLALGGFLALLALGAVGHALVIAVRRRRHELAVLRTLGLTSGRSRLVVVTQATVLAVIGLALGIPLGLAVGRAVWRVVADFTPLAYSPAALGLGAGADRAGDPAGRQPAGRLAWLPRRAAASWPHPARE